MKINLTLLGGLSVDKFLREYWQKKPLLIRQAIPGFNGLLDPAQLAELACNPEAQSRLVQFKRNKWHLQHGPFDEQSLDSLGKSGWTLLVQGINHFLPGAADLLQQFSFIPHSRLDDLMVSYAPKNGGVGPHFDSYDVFLLQGMGHRRWQISAQQDRTLIPDAPLRILQNFSPEEDWILEPGDMLYLPPHWAHNGIAQDNCMTYSIGFRTPSYHELGEQFLVYLQDHLKLDGMYADPDLKPQAHPSEISADMLQQVKAVIQKIRWNDTDIARFLGTYMSEPKPHVYFDPPDNPMSHKRFIQSLDKSGIRLDLKSLMLCHDNCAFINGEAHDLDTPDIAAIRLLADTRQFPAHSQLSSTATDMLYAWYQEGFLVFPGKK